ncbi:hypothetical protein [Hydrogenothermus marinus]|uniref:NitT/TauT family transport system substrate-binding protein n=1 Tax=Hydrogenothermus marinus TaxID=133270 RepID=A0A3M0BI45_9AQUI|nr:hypothetical protein [Hydrogenothermus marinus]RMA97093.1 hypothetical protein CLV39_0748 [Hydrogenothermus marinus]
MNFLKYLFIIIFIILTYSCNQKNEILKVGTNVWPGYEPIYIAREIGKLDKNIKLYKKYNKET